ncbi:MAG: hypothetical protein BWK80_12410 [Desulfobacteraceae bacterium IS3]|nr:MAG: hypothetical protein BWK80_12410 [Desulfobacteraceae bacterium IS3]
MCEPSDSDFQNWLTGTSGSGTNLSCDDVFCSNVSEIPESECKALLSFYNSTDGKNWSDKSGWLDTTTPCTWKGVVCEDGHVAQLKLSGNHLVGTLPSELGDLAYLKELYVDNNQLSESLPKELTGLDKLSSLYFDDTGLCEPSDAAFQDWMVRLSVSQDSGLICDETLEERCSKATLHSSGNGKWNVSSAWSEGRIPNENDVVMIEAGHTVIAAADMTLKVKGICIYGTVETEAGNNFDLSAAEFVYNEGTVHGADGKDGTGSDASNYVHATAGTGISLEAPTVYNAITGNIQAGRGGHDILPIYSLKAKGGDGGNVQIYGEEITNEGVIGPVCNDYTYGNNGGQARSVNTAQGGNGGNTVIVGTGMVINKKTGKISGGNGGNVYGSSGIRTPGKAGNLTFSAPVAVQNGILRSCGGGIDYEPSISVSGADARIEGKDIRIFGGENWVLDLSNVGTDAISATDTITLALGTGGTINLKGSAGIRLRAGVSVKIFADSILTDEGVSLKDIIDAPEIITEPAKIIRDVVLNAPKQIQGHPGESVQIQFCLINNSPVADSYLVEIRNAEGEILNALSSSAEIQPFGMKKLSLDDFRQISHRYRCGCRF